MGYCKHLLDNLKSRLLLLTLLTILLGGVEAGVEADYRGTLKSDIDAIIDSPSTPAAVWGVRIEDSESGEVVYSRNGDTPFIPASVTKLITTAVALDHLGPDYTFTTHLQFPVNGDLYIIGGGDPTLGTAEGAGGRSFLDGWAEQLAKQGVDRVKGDIVGVDALFVEEPQGAGWAWDDASYPFAAQPSALTVNGGTVGYIIDKNRKQRLKKSQVHLYPKSEYMEVVTQTTAEKSRLHIRRKQGSNQFVVEMPEKMRKNPKLSGKVTVDNPTLYTATLFREALERAGVKVEGEARDGDKIGSRHISDNSDATLVWTHHSKPLKDILPLANKRSINLVAENILRATGVKRGRDGEIKRAGSVARGVKTVDRFMAERNIKPYRYKQVDGSGLSRYNLFRPADIVSVLRSMQSHPQAKVFHNSLSRAGHDGTLRWRFNETPLEGRVWGKTGTLSAVRAVAGYLKTPKGRELTFSIMANNYPFGSRKIRNRIDSILLKSAEWADRSQKNHKR